jgi:hypothetical protein
LHKVELSKQHHFSYKRDHRLKFDIKKALNSKVKILLLISMSICLSCEFDMMGGDPIYNNESNSNSTTGSDSNSSVGSDSDNASNTGNDSIVEGSNKIVLMELENRVSWSSI